MISVNLTKREKYIFVTAACFIGVAILYNFIFEPIMKKLHALDTEVFIKKFKFGKNLKLLEKRNAVIEEYNNYAKSSKHVPQILNYIENLAGSMAIKTSNIRPSSVRQAVFYKEYDIELQIEGGLPDIIKFLSELVKFPVFLTVKKFDFRTLSENPAFFKGSVILSKIII